MLLLESIQVQGLGSAGDPAGIGWSRQEVLSVIGNQEC